MKVTGAMIGSSLDIDLGSSDKTGILSGPLLLKSGEDTIISANLELKATTDQFMLSVDVASPEDEKIRSRGMIDITAKRESGSDDIVAPRDTKKFQEFADALGALGRDESFIENIDSQGQSIESPMATPIPPSS
jgi:hypothetical protein